MSEHILEVSQQLNSPLEKVFEFFADAGNLEKITPPELNFHITTPQPIDIKKDTLIDYNLKLRGLPIKWRTLISEWNPPFSFIDQQLSGPYKQWIHLHTFSKISENETLVMDKVRYRLPFEPFGDIAHFFVRRELDYIFAYRHKVIAEIFKVG